MKTEFEAKYLNINKQELRTSLKEKGYTRVHPERMMRRVTMDIDSKNPFTRYCRVRDEGNQVTLTYKQVENTQSIDGVKEIEVVVDNFENTLSLIEQLCSGHISYQENLREEWVKHDVHISLDTWPGLPTFCEIEGCSKEKVHTSSLELGFNLSDAIFGTVIEVYEAHNILTLEEIKNLSRLTFDNIGS